MGYIVNTYLVMVVYLESILEMKTRCLRLQLNCLLRVDFPECHVDIGYTTIGKPGYLAKYVHFLLKRKV